jgi:hypothetical protein
VREFWNAFRKNAPFAFNGSVDQVMALSYHCLRILPLPRGRRPTPSLIPCMLSFAAWRRVLRN